MRVYSETTGKSLVVKYFAGDTEVAQYNAYRSVFNQWDKSQYLMCYFHIKQNVKRCYTGLSISDRASIARCVYDIHHTSSNSEFLRCWQSRPVDGDNDVGLFEFWVYFEKQ